MRELKIIPISGGLDSTYLLYHYLKYTNYTIHAHHIILKNEVEPRWEEEYTACKNIVKYCQKIREFTYTESTWDFPYHCWDFEVVAFCAGQIARKICRENDKISLCAGIVLNDVERTSSGVTRTKRFEGIWAASTITLGKKRSLKFEAPLMCLSKLDLLKRMPKELSNMCWSCRHPIDGATCGRCHACKELNEAKEQYDHDMLVN